MEWRPIETITPEASQVLFFGATLHDANITFSGHIARNGLYYSDGGETCHPTHWMPKPGAPVADHNKGETE